VDESRQIDKSVCVYIKLKGSCMYVHQLLIKKAPYNKESFLICMIVIGIWTLDDSKSKDMLCLQKGNRE
jgi:hypothetical protein